MNYLSLLSLLFHKNDRLKCDDKIHWKLSCHCSMNPFTPFSVHEYILLCCEARVNSSMKMSSHPLSHKHLWISALSKNFFWFSFRSQILLNLVHLFEYKPRFFFSIFLNVVSEMQAKLLFSEICFFIQATVSLHPIFSFKNEETSST